MYGRHENAAGMVVAQRYEHDHIILHVDLPSLQNCTHAFAKRFHTAFSALKTLTPSWRLRNKIAVVQRCFTEYSPNGLIFTILLGLDHLVSPFRSSFVRLLSRTLTFFVTDFHMPLGGHVIILLWITMTLLFVGWSYFAFRRKWLDLFFPSLPTWFSSPSQFSIITQQKRYDTQRLSPQLSINLRFRTTPRTRRESIYSFT